MQNFFSRVSSPGLPVPDLVPPDDPQLLVLLLLLLHPLLVPLDLVGREDDGGGLVRRASGLGGQERSVVLVIVAVIDVEVLPDGPTRPAVQLQGGDEKKFLFFPLSPTPWQVYEQECQSVRQISL